MWLVLCAGLPPALAADTPAPSIVPTARTADEWAAVKTDPAHGSAGLLITTLYQAGRVEEAAAARQLAFLAVRGRREEALLTRSRDAVDAERQRLGLGALRREGK